MKVLDLFSGIGGFSLGLERAGMKTVAFCEIDPFCRKVLRKHWPDVPIYDDIAGVSRERLNADGITSVDGVVGGFPCQPFSTASRGRKTAPDLWPEMARVVNEIRPKFCIAENVQREPISRSANFFVGMGLSCDVIRVSAASVGADHERNRWWAVAHTYEGGKFPRALNAEASKLPEISRRLWGPQAYRAAVRLSDGVPSELDNAGVYGNAVLPIIPEIIGRAIMECAA